MAYNIHNSLEIYQLQNEEACFPFACYDCYFREEKKSILVRIDTTCQAMNWQEHLGRKGGDGKKKSTRT